MARLGNTAARSDTSAMTGLSAIEVVIILVYLAGTFGIALYLGRQKEEAGNTADYFLAGRALPWYLIGLSFYASNMSGASFVGLIGASYGHGLTVFNYEWTATFVLIFFALFIAPVFLRNRLYTVTEYLERRYERRTRVAYSLFTLMTLLFIDTAGALYAGAVVVSTGFPAIGLWPACILISICVGIYTIFGGLRAVVITDALQAGVLIIGAILVAGFGLAAVGGVDQLVAKLDQRHLTLFHAANDEFLPWPGILGVVVLGFYYWTFNQYFVQRALAARSLDDGRKGALLGGLLKLVNLALMIMPGLVAIALYPALSSPDRAFPTLAFDLLPAGARGIVLAAMLAAIMSSLDSALNAAASLVTMDFIKPVWPTTSDRRLATIGKAVTAVIMLFAALYAPLIAGFGSLFGYFQATLAYLVPPVVAIYMAGLFARRISTRSAFWALVIIEPVAFALFLLQQFSGVWESMGLPAVHFTTMAVVLLAVTFAALAVLSVVLPDQDRRVEAATVVQWSDITAADKQHRGWGWSDYRVLAALLTFVTLALIIVLVLLE